MRFNFDGVPIDLPYSKLNTMTIPQNLDVLNSIYLTNISEVSLRSLSHVRATQHILHLVPDIAWLLCSLFLMASPGFTNVFAALVSVVNNKFPEIGDLLLSRIILQFRRSYERNDKPQLLAAVKFIAHLVNQ